MKRGWLVVGVCALAACDQTLPEIDAIYSRPGDGRIVCGYAIDNKNTVSTDSIGTGLDRASAEQEIIHLYSHKPEGTVDAITIEEVIASAADRDLPFVTYDQLVGAHEDDELYGLALSFDDHDLVGWHPLIPLFAQYGARVTFFISAYHTLTEDEVAMLRDLQAAGHSIQYHGTFHENAADRTKALGGEGYLGEEIRPDLQLMRDAGFDPQVFAYPFGARSRASDEAVLTEFALARGSFFNCPR